MFVEYEPLKNEDRYIEAAVNAVSPYTGCSIIAIEQDENLDKVIHYLADSYFDFNANDEKFASMFVEYSFVKIPFQQYLTLEDLIKELDSSGILERATQYVDGCIPEDLTNIYSNYDTGVKPTLTDKITEDLPFGQYIFCPQEKLKALRTL